MFLKLLPSKFTKCCHLKLQFLGLLPSELGLLAAKVAVAAALLVDGASKLQIADLFRHNEKQKEGVTESGVQQQQATYDAARAQVEVVLHNLHQLLFGLLAGAVGVDVDAEGLRHTNGIGQLDQAAAAKPSLDQGFRDPTGSVSGRAIHLGGVLSGESATAVGAPTTVSVHNDLAASETSVTVGTANDETA